MIVSIFENHATEFPTYVVLPIRAFHLTHFKYQPSQARYTTLFMIMTNQFVWYHILSWLTNMQHKKCAKINAK
jgi:hypothetical protein